LAHGVLEYGSIGVRVLNALLHHSSTPATISLEPADRAHPSAVLRAIGLNSI
jgi:hypothetical protein